ncbi:hypothetical protein SO694_00023413 [Aureococcus anophagefferens]|uniref:RxLR effector protein n=1 Tax=Aureococcus anophagefferens TaxID=44056 RepID=A0ABR1FTV2_AURAN
MYSLHAILALAVGAAAFGSSSSATSSEDLESIEATLDHVEEMHTQTSRTISLNMAFAPRHRPYEGRL